MLCAEIVANAALDQEKLAPGAVVAEADTQTYSWSGYNDPPDAVFPEKSVALPLPSLSNGCVIVGEPKRADLIWSAGDFLALCEHMHNDNSSNVFLAVWRDKTTGQARFAKAPLHKRADKHANWAWNTIIRKGSGKTSIGFYPSNREKKSRWAAIDFDAHNGEHDQAKTRALRAFTLLREQPQLHLVLCASGNGYHLFAFAREMYQVGDWIVLLKQACERIGVSIKDGICEIFPNERAESQPTGKGIRAPGTWNPKSDTCSLILAETVAPLLKTLPRTWSLGVGKVNGPLPRKSTPLSLHKRTNTYFLTTYSGSTESLAESLLVRYPVTEKGTRNSVLMHLIGDLIHKFGREAAERIVEEHYRRNQENIGSPFDEHRREFVAAWDRMHKKIVDSLSAEERQKFDALNSDHQREGFVIVRAFAGVAACKRAADFVIAQASLADRLSITPPGAGGVIEKLCDVQVIALTQPYVPQTQSARFRWLLGGMAEAPSIL